MNFLVVTETLIYKKNRLSKVQNNQPSNNKTKDQFNTKLLNLLLLFI